jgi:hypothetical protein
LFVIEDLFTDCPAETTSLAELTAFVFVQEFAIHNKVHMVHCEHALPVCRVAWSEFEDISVVYDVLKRVYRQKPKNWVF